MSAAPPPVETAPPSAWPMYRSMVGVGLVCGLLIVTVFVATRPVIRRNKAIALQRAIFQVLPEARSSRTFELSEGAGFVRLAPESADSAADLVHAGYDDRGRLVGLAVEARGMGYQDVITVLYAYGFELDAVIGLRVLESRETPGLGDRIETDPAFLANFARLDVSLSEDGSRVLHPIEAVKRGEKEHPWQVDGITGATISSKAIASILSRSTEEWIPRIRSGLDDFRETEQ